jgi:hypothetical protein
MSFEGTFTTGRCSITLIQWYGGVVRGLRPLFGLPGWKSRKAAIFRYSLG